MFGIIFIAGLAHFRRFTFFKIFPFCLRDFLNFKGLPYIFVYGFAEFLSFFLLLLRLIVGVYAMCFNTLIQADQNTIEINEKEVKEPEVTPISSPISSPINSPINSPISSPIISPHVSPPPEPVEPEPTEPAPVQKSAVTIELKPASPEVVEVIIPADEVSHTS